MADASFLTTLWSTIQARKADPSDAQSWTRQLLARPSKARKKLIEEAYEVAEAHQGILAGQDSKDHLAQEAADVVYHLMVLLASAEVEPGAVWAVLESRHGTRRPSGTP